MKMRWCPKCTRKQIITKRGIYNRSKKEESKPFLCLICNKRFSYKEMELIPKTGLPKIINPGRVEMLKKALLNHCSIITSDNRKLKRKNNN